MPEYIFTGEITLRGVVFTIQAENETAAMIRAESDDYDEYDAKGAELSDWTIRRHTCKLNE